MQAHKGPEDDDVVCFSLSWAVCPSGGVVHKARPGAERGERPQGGVGRRPSPGAQHFQRRRSCVAPGSAGKEEDVERGGGEEVESGTSLKKDMSHCLLLLLWLPSAEKLLLLSAEYYKNPKSKLKERTLFDVRTDQLRFSNGSIFVY